MPVFIKYKGQLVRQEVIIERRKKAEAAKLQEMPEKEVKEALKEINQTEEKQKSDIEIAREKYTEVLGKDVPNRYKNDAKWLAAQVLAKLESQN